MVTGPRHVRSAPGCHPTWNPGFDVVTGARRACVCRGSPGMDIVVGLIVEHLLSKRPLLCCPFSVLPKERKPQLTLPGEPYTLEVTPTPGSPRCCPTQVPDWISLTEPLGPAQAARQVRRLIALPPPSPATPVTFLSGTFEAYTIIERIG